MNRETWSSGKSMYAASSPALLVCRAAAWSDRTNSEMKITTAVQEPIEVLCVTAEDGIAGAKPAFERLERCFSSLRGRRFYGVLQHDGTYRACVARAGGDDAEKMGLKPWVLPGGLYARTVIPNWEDHVAEIGVAFARMAEAHAEDPQRPSIEFYRSRKELILLLPIRER